MGTDFLSLEIRLLIAKHGRQRLLECLAKVVDVRVPDLEREIEALAVKAATRDRGAGSKRRPTAEQTASQLPGREGERHAKILELARRFDAGLFLTTNSDVSAFLGQSKGAEKKRRTRSESVTAVVRMLASLNDAELVALLSDSGGSNKSEYYKLAKEIMKRRESDE